MIYLGDKFCPDCGGTLRQYDHVQRRIKFSYGKNARVRISRKQCRKCGKIHRELPTYILPFKHYHASIIDGFRSGRYSTSDPAFEDYPTQVTVSNWCS